MRNLTQEIAQQIVAKATTQFGTTRFGSRLAELINVPQPYVSHIKTLAETGENKIPFSSTDKFLTFLNSDTRGVAQQIESYVTETHLGSSVEEKTDEEVLGDIQLRFSMASHSVISIFRGGQSGVIISGPAGCGKSHNIEKQIKAEQNRLADEGVQLKYSHLKGATMSYTGLYELLFEFREGGVIVFDDSDGIWSDESMMNLMKAAMDTSKIRTISTASGGKWVGEIADRHNTEIEDVRTFQFKGKIIFITNKDINGIIDSGKRGSEHYAALVDRCFYIDLEMFHPRSRFLWCEYVFTTFLVPQMGLSQELSDDIMNFVTVNQDKMRDISIRGIEIIANAALDAHNIDSVDNDSWKSFIEVARFRHTAR